MIDDEKHHGDNYGQAQSTFTDDATQWCPDEEENDASDAQGKLLVPFLSVLVDVLDLRIEVQLVEANIVFGVLCTSDSHVYNGGSRLIVEFGK